MGELRLLRDQLLSFCKDRGLKGTILLAPEGINLFVAGPHRGIEDLVFELRRMPGLEDLMPKYSESGEQPFSRMLVRLKKEIIAFGVEEIEPAVETAPRIQAKELKRWLDEGRPVVLLDTRNDYEVKLGTFTGAVPAGIRTFRDFPQAVEALPEEMKEAEVVTFCTGGIRCEKAAPYMQKQGFKNVWQLDGGILKYFEEVGGSHYDGECFVFDQRVGVDPALRETGSVVCFVCQAPLSEEEALDPRYVPDESCPYCYRSDERKQAAAVARRQHALDEVVAPLPGSLPYDNRKPLRVPEGQNGKCLIEALEGLFPHVGRELWLKTIAEGRLLDPKGAAARAEQVVRAGESYLRLHPETVEPEVSGAVKVLHEDEAIVVIEKPAPLPMHACGRFNRNTLEYFLRQAWYPEVPRPAHRLDANTTGVVVCARTRHFAKLLQPQFSRGEVEKSYRVKVHGWPEKDRFVADYRISAEPGGSGGREVDEEEGQEARTEFRVLRRISDGTSLLEAVPWTGRTNQIRVHLWQEGHPVVGDPLYLTEGRRGERQTISLSEPPMCLHAWRISFRHPLSGERVAFESGIPDWG